MYKLVFYNEDRLCARLYEESAKNVEKADEKELLDLLETLNKNIHKIKNIYYSGDDLNFRINNLNIVLRNKDNFLNDERFNFIFNNIKNKRFKLIKKVIKITAIISLAGALTVVGMVSLHAKENKIIDNSVEKTNLSSTYKQESSTALYNDEIKTEDITSSTYVDEEKDKTKEDSFISYGLTTKNYQKLKFVKENYGNIIKKYSDKYNLDYNLMCAIATQERGVHSDRVDEGGAIGLMQIQLSVLDGKEIEVYNYDINKIEKISITKEKLKDVNFNVMVGCAIYQNCLEQMKGNLIAATQSYNMGPYAVKKILLQYALSTKKTLDEVLENQNDIGWLSYRNGYAGDSKYVEHVFRFYENNKNVKLEVENNIKK